MGKTAQVTDQNDVTTLNRESVRHKLAGLWTTLMFLYIYADYFDMKAPGTLEQMSQLETPVGPVTPWLLVIFSILLIIPALMISISLLAKLSLTRWLNMSFGSFYAIISILIISTETGQAWRAFYVLYNMVELVILAIIIIRAWKLNTNSP